MRIKNASILTSHGNIKGRQDIIQILEAGLQAGDPYTNAKKLLRLEGNTLYVGNPAFEPKGDPQSGISVYDLNEIERIYVVGAGKGCQRVGLAFEEVLGDRLTGGHLIGKHGDEIILNKIGVTLGGHPTPDEGCAEGCRKILALSKDITERDLVFTVAANGVSSLLTLPAEGITLQQVHDLTYMMQIEKGVPTAELNTIRNHIDQMKGGRLSKHFQKAKLVHVEAIDINMRIHPGCKGDYEELMRTNIWLHNLPEGSTFADAVRTLKFWDAWDRTPDSIKNHLLAARPEDETVKYDEFHKMDFRVFGIMPDNTAIIPTAKAKAAELGYRALTLVHFLHMDASQAGLFAAQMARNIEEQHEPLVPPIALISGGELLVTVGDETGVGGRNQEYVLSAALRITGSDKVVIGAVDTDGTDGPGGTIADGAPHCLAGGLADGYTLKEAEEKGVNIREALKTHSASQAVWALDSGIHAEQNISMGDLGVILVME